MNSLARRLTCGLALFLGASGCATTSTPKTHSSAHIAPAEAVVGVHMDADTMRRIAQHNLPAAIAILRFHPDHWIPINNLLVGEMAFMKAPTMATLEVMLASGSDEDMLASMHDLSDGTFLGVGWQATHLPSQQLEVRFESSMGSSAQAAVAAHPDVTIIVDKQRAELVSFGLGDDQPAISKVIPPDAVDTLHTYLKSLLSFDYTGASALVHHEIKKRIPDDVGVENFLARIETSLPQWYELGEPVVYSSDRHELALFPARHVTEGFPANIRMPRLFAVASGDGGASWGVVDNGCFDINWAQTLFPGFDKNEVQRVQQAPFKATTLVTLKDQRIATR